jgi:hypothetical protein
MPKRKTTTAASCSEQEKQDRKREQFQRALVDALNQIAAAKGLAPAQPEKE